MEMQEERESKDCDLVVFWQGSEVSMSDIDAGIIRRCIVSDRVRALVFYYLPLLIG
jgi:hypothetical protein